MEGVAGETFGRVKKWPGSVIVVTARCDSSSGIAVLRDSNATVAKSANVL